MPVPHSCALCFGNWVESQAVSGGWMTYIGLAFVLALQRGKSIPFRCSQVEVLWLEVWWTPFL